MGDGRSDGLQAILSHPPPLVPHHPFNRQPPAIVIGSSSLGRNPSDSEARRLVRGPCAPHPSHLIPDSNPRSSGESSLSPPLLLSIPADHPIRRVQGPHPHIDELRRSSRKRMACNHHACRSLGTSALRITDSGRADTCFYSSKFRPVTAPAHCMDSERGAATTVSMALARASSGRGPLRRENVLNQPCPTGYSVGSGLATGSRIYGLYCIRRQTSG